MLYSLMVKGYRGFERRCTLGLGAYRKEDEVMRFIVIGLLFLGLLAPLDHAHAMNAAEINARVDEALQKFYKKSPAGKKLAGQAKGILVFPKVYKAGIGVGGEYGEGALRVGGRTVNYYSTASGSFGFQLGAQARTQILMFMTADSLNKFRKSDGWEVGVDGSVALITIGAGEDFDTNTVKAPIVGFVMNNQGLMFNVSLEGTKISKINRK